MSIDHKKPMHNKKISDYLERLGLSDLEAKIYITLLGSGPISVRELADLVGIKRTRTYLHIDSLIEKGLVTKIIRGARKQIIVNQPESSLKHLVDEKTEATKKVQSEFSDILKSITTETTMLQEMNNAETRYYKGKLGVKKIYEEVLKAKEIRSYVNIEEIIKVFPENSSLFDNALKQNLEMRMFEIVENSREAKKRFGLPSNKKERYFYKLLPENMKLTAQDILIYDDKVAIIHFKDNINGIILCNKDLYNNFKMFFDFIWKMLPQ